MATTLINLTLLKVIGELEDIIGSYPEQIHEILSKSHDLQQKLLAYVLNRIHNRYITVEEQDIPSLLPSICCSTLEKTEIEELIKQGIYYLLFEENKIQFSHLAWTTNVNYSASEWLN